MMTPPPQRDQQRGRVTWCYSIDLTALNIDDQIYEVGLVTRATSRGGYVQLSVGKRRPGDYELAWGLEERLAELVAAGVNVHIIGAPGVVAAWWHALRGTRPRPNLQVVR